MGKKKMLTILLLALGVAVMIAGVAILGQNGEHHTGNGGGIFRASTSVEYGADFYTDSVQATGLAANAVIDLYQLLSIAIGIFFLFIGGLDITITLLLTDMATLFQKEPTAETKEKIEIGEPVTEEVDLPVTENQE